MIKQTLSSLTLFAVMTATPLLATSSKSCTDTLSEISQEKSVFQLPGLPYSFDALEPYMDKKTMEIHHDRHHKTYVDNLNKAIKDSPWQEKTLSELFKIASRIDPKIRNNAGGHFNHSMYWLSLTDDAKKKVMPERLEKELIASFGSIEKFKQQFESAGLDRLGSGYAWLYRAKNGKLEIGSTPNQDNPLMDDAPIHGTPLLVCDVWEHAYYLKYLNKRGDFLSSFWNVVNWQHVADLAYPGEKK